MKKEKVKEKCQNSIANIKPWLWLFPSLLFVVLFSIVPFFKTVISSFFSVDRAGRLVNYSGIKNYRLLWQDNIFFTSIRNTVLFVLLTVPTTLLLSFITATLSTEKQRRTCLYETMLSLPCAVSMSVAALIFQTMFMPSLGIINKLTGLQIQWLYDENYALLALAIIQIWSSSAFAYIYYSSALRSIPRSFIDCAKLAGANYFQMLRYVYWPMTFSTTVFLLFANVSTSMMMMSLSNILTNGGPKNSTITILQYVYRKFTSTGNMTISNAASVIYFLLSFSICLLLFWIFEKWRKMQR